MAWQIEFTARAKKGLRRLDKPIQRRILAELRAIADLDNPRSRGQAMTDNLAGLWRWRVGDWRIVAEILDEHVLITAVDIDHRSRIYKRLS